MELEFMYPQIIMIEAMQLGELEEDEEILIRMKNEKVSARKRLRR